MIINFITHIVQHTRPTTRAVIEQITTINRKVLEARVSLPFSEVEEGGVLLSVSFDVEPTYLYKLSLLVL